MENVIHTIDTITAIVSHTSVCAGWLAMLARWAFLEIEHHKDHKTKHATPSYWTADDYNSKR